MIKTERTQIHFLSHVLVAVVSLDLIVPIGFAGRNSAPVFFSFPKRRIAKYSLATRGGTALVNISLDACGHKMRKRPSPS